MTEQLDGIFILAGDFYPTDLRTVLPEFHQHVHIPATRRNTLNHVYRNITGSYKDLRRPHFGQSDHVSLLLLPADKKRVRPSARTVQSVHR